MDYQSSGSGAKPYQRHKCSRAVAPTVFLTEMGRQAWGAPEKGEPMKAQIPSGRFGQPVEIADLVLFLAPAASDSICGQVILIAGGNTAI